MAALSRLLPSDPRAYVQLQLQALQCLPRRPKSVTADSVAAARERLAAGAPAADPPPIQPQTRTTREEVEALLEEVRGHPGIPQQLFAFKIFRKTWLVSELLPALFAWRPRRAATGGGLLAAKHDLTARLREGAFLRRRVLAQYR